MPYSKFMPANVLGAFLWTVGTTTAVYFLGVAAETWLKRFSYVGLALAIVGGVTLGILVRKRIVGLLEQAPEPGTDPAT
jgi:membrane protein DedA with SNARE-associated domain